jgi:hypothetical protein
VFGKRAKNKKIGTANTPQGQLEVKKMPKITTPHSKTSKKNEERHFDKNASVHSHLGDAETERGGNALHKRRLEGWFHCGGQCGGQLQKRER